MKFIHRFYGSRICFTLIKIKILKILHPQLGNTLQWSVLKWVRAEELLIIMWMGSYHKSNWPRLATARLEMWPEKSFKFLSQRFGHSLMDFSITSVIFMALFISNEKASFDKFIFKKKTAANAWIIEQTDECVIALCRNVKKTSWSTNKRSMEVRLFELSFQFAFRVENKDKMRRGGTDKQSEHRL